MDHDLNPPYPAVVRCVEQKSQIDVTVGEEFTIRLESIPTTGYVWEVHRLPEGVQLLRTDYEKPRSGMRPGDPVIQIFRFRLQEAGERTIDFALRRKWEDNPIKSHAVTVRANH